MTLRGSVLLGCLALWACGNRSSEPSAEPACIPNEVTACTCSNGLSGQQACAPDGLSLSKCLCTESTAPGAGNDPGASPTGVGTAGTGTGINGSAGQAPASGSAGSGQLPGFPGTGSAGSGLPGLFGGSSGSGSPGFFGGGSGRGGSSGGSAGSGSAGRSGLCQFFPQLCAGSGSDESDAGVE
jgi:hypothetical protein